jgi:hypothetical protein
MTKGEKQRRKLLIEKARENRPSKYTEEDMLENNSFWDVDYLEEHNAPIRREINYWENTYQPSSNMGKWWQSVRVQSLKKKLKDYVHKDKPDDK